VRIFGIDEIQNTKHPIHMSAENTKSQISFRLRIQPYSAKHIAAAIGCSAASAYDWRSGRRTPPKWLHDRYVEDIRNHSQIKP
jgi:hypothetical protein